MQNNQTVSLNKLIGLIIFVCAALITLLFVFHWSQPAKQKLVNGDITVFSVARDIQPFALTTADNQSFTQKDFLNHWTLLFFGFTHCSSICPTTLDLMSRVYSQLHASYPNLQVVLVSLDPERDTPTALKKYTTSYNSSFIGATSNIQDLRKLQSQFGIFSARDDASGNDYQIQHTSSIMLVNPQGKWAGLFRFGMNVEQFVNAYTQGTGAAA